MIYLILNVTLYRLGSRMLRKEQLSNIEEAELYVSHLVISGILFIVFYLFLVLLFS